MKISEWQKRKIELMAEYFDFLGFLYLIYYEKFPEYRALWEEMINHAINNAEWLKASIKKIEENDYYYDLSRFKIESIKSGLGYLKDIIDKHSDSDVTLKEALSTSLGFENGIIALKFTEIVKAKDPEFSNCINDLKNENKKFMKKLNKEINSLYKNSEYSMNWIN